MPMILGIDTSAKTASAAVCDGERIIAQSQLNTPLTHSQTALPMVQAMLDCARLMPEDLDLFAVSAGPGSFTGLRIGVAAVKALAFTLGKPCAGVSTLEAMARNMTGIDGVVCSVMDARCQQVYTALFEVSEGGKRFERLCADSAISLQELEERLAGLKKTEKPAILVGDGAEMCYNILKERMEIRLAPPMLRYQTGYGVCMAAREALERGETVAAHELMPVYLRLPQAERERNARLGINSNK